MSEDDADFQRILKTQGRKEQQLALDNPEPYNDETSEMLAWFDVEIQRRGFVVAGKKAVDILASAIPSPLETSVDGVVGKRPRRKANGADVIANMGH